MKLLPLIGALSVTLGASAQTTFVDQADTLGISYARTASANDLSLQAAKQASLAGPIPLMPDFVLTGIRTRGTPGVAMLDYDGDGDLDFYLTNGPGTANSLYQNQFADSGAMGFVDVAATAGAELISSDNTGVCYGDIDNDGDEDLFVLGRGGDPNSLLLNQGNGTFVPTSGGAGGSGLGGSSCSMGDVTGNGLLDIFVANAFDMETKLAIVAEPFALNHPNDLFINQGGATFTNEAAARGLNTGPQLITWAATVVDYDQDGDQDIIAANDQAVIPRAVPYGGVDRGFINLWRNDGSGQFEKVTLPFIGNHMGIDLADYNHDGALDMVVADGGDYLVPFFGAPYTQGDDTTRWYLGDGAGGFTDPGVGALIASPFAWGIVNEDYDNDGDTDIVHVGGLEAGSFVDLSNPGTVLANDGSAGFSYDQPAFDDYGLRRNGHGLGAGDLNGDGHIDFVEVSDQVFPEAIPLVSFPIDYGSPWDPAAFIPMWQPTNPEGTMLQWTGVDGDNGTAAVLINQGNDNRSVFVDTVGSHGITNDGANNRSGIGSIVSFTPWHGATAMRPVLGGASYASQSNTTLHFGLGRSRHGKVDVLWPNGVRNRLYKVRRGETVTLPEIPCSYDTSDPFGQYVACVASALADLQDHGVINGFEKARLFFSATAAYFD